MKKLAIIFILAVLAPSVALAWLAMQSLKHQEMVVQGQLALLHQGRADAVAGDVRVAMDDIRSYFGTLVHELVEEHGAGEYLFREFDPLVRAHWGQALAGCVVTEDGTWVAPMEDSTEPRVQEFVRENFSFLTNRAPAEVYQAPLPLGNVIQLENMQTTTPARPAPQKYEVPEERLTGRAASAGMLQEEIAEAVPQMSKETSSQSKEEPSAERTRVGILPGKLRSIARNDVPAAEKAWEKTPEFQGPDKADTTLETKSGVAPAPAPALAPAQSVSSAPAPQQKGAVFLEQTERRVEPFAQIGDWGRAADVAQQALGFNDRETQFSNFRAAAGEVQEIIAGQPEGAISRFLPDGLHVLLWYRHPEIDNHIFWVELDLSVIRDDLAEVIELASAGESSTRKEACLALLDSNSQPVARSVPEFSTDWRKPFVASEVGEILPSWEVAAYLLNPAQVASSARTARLTLWLLVPILLAAIGFGSLLVFRDVGREMHAARQKTDFVSNVSHELKTPLTSIRMFSDLLSGSREGSTALDPEKVGSYAGVISTEAARLTRLINNLLDFSRMERGEKKYDRTEFDAVELASEVMENYRIQIESEGLSLSFQDLVGSPAPVHGDRDALAQVLLNLISNAEKYGASGGSIEVVASRSRDGQWVELRVLDRGPGVPRREAARIFEKFYRVDDSLSTGIQGSGLGLTLARQIARAHGGDVEFCDREDGKSGSCFVLRLPASQTGGQS